MFSGRSDCSSCKITPYSRYKLQRCQREPWTFGQSDNCYKRPFDSPNGSDLPQFEAVGPSNVLAIVYIDTAAAFTYLLSDSMPLSFCELRPWTSL